ncbi:MAG: helix-turn-helix transcriptional regulator [Rubrivivax sp.]
MFDLETLIPAGLASRQPSLQTIVPQTAAHTAHAAHAANSSSSGYRGPERRSAASQGSRWLALALDEVDFGMVLVADEGQVLHANHAARAELDAGHPLQLLGRELRARLAADANALQDALAAARRGLRRMVHLGERDQKASIVVVPLGVLAAGGPQASLLMLNKREVCGNLSAQCFASSHGLTPAETRVLLALSQGKKPREVAEAHGVGLATVRTQIGSIRAKTGTAGIRDLVSRVATLPPMVSSLRMN